MNIFKILIKKVNKIINRKSQLEILAEKGFKYGENFKML